MRKKLIIKLISDLCSGSGDSYNSSIDTDIVYDDYGLPYIPAKRLKGCIRESLLELIDFSVYTDEMMKRLFGDADNQSSFTLSDARLLQYKDYVHDLRINKVSPQRILDLFAYSRTQTSIDPKTGTAEENHLRTKRVLKKGLSFEADLSFSDALNENDIEAFISAAQNVLHIGINRTRGLGMVSITVEDQKDENTSGSEEYSFDDSKNIIRYTISLNSPVLCKSPEGNQARTQPYFDGNKFLGIVAGTMDNKDFCELMDKEPIFSTAYIKCNNKRSVPVSCSLQKIKDSSFDENGEMKAYDLLFKPETKDQLTGIGNSYITDDGYITEVDTEINYHHRRPNNKAIGHSTGKDDSSFYQLESIRAGQQFEGFVVADRESAEIISSSVSRLKDVRLGYSRNTQYGSVDITIDSIEGMPTKEQINGDFIMKINSPVIMYNDNGAYSTEIVDLIKYLAEALNISPDGLEIKNSCISYETVGGYNVTQRCRKPIFQAIGRGSVFLISTNQSFETDSYLFIGERITEGYGEISINQANNSGTIILRKPQYNDQMSDKELRSDIIAKIDHKKALDQLVGQAIADAAELSKDKISDATISKLLLIYKDQRDIDTMQREVDSLAKEDKKELGKKIMRRITEQKEKNSSIEEREFYEVYVRTVLTELKYRLRAKNGMEDADNG